MRIRWSLPAAEQLEQQIRFVQRDNYRRSLRLARYLKARIKELTSFPLMGRPGIEEGTRELVVSPYIIVYRIKDTVVEILNVYHGAEDR